MNNQESLFEEANKNTKQILEKIIVYKNNMVDELNFIAKQAIMSAKVELAMAQAEGIPYDRCSALAQELLRNPNLTLDKQFKVVELVEQSAVCEDNKINNVANYNVVNLQNAAAADEKDEDEGLSLYFSERETRKEPTKKRSHAKRTWLALQSIKTDECEIKIEVARLTQNDQKTKEKILVCKSSKKEENKPAKTIDCEMSR